MPPFEMRELEHAVEHHAVDGKPNGEHGTFERLFGYVESVHEFPSEIQGEGKERHPVGFGLEGFAGVEEVGDSPETATDLKEEVGDGDEIGGDVWWRDVVGAHFN